MERCAKVCYLSTFSCSFWWDYLWCNTYTYTYTWCLLYLLQLQQMCHHHKFTIRPAADTPTEAQFWDGSFSPLCQNDCLFELWPSQSLLCKGQFFRWTAWQSDAYQSQIISHIWQSASIFFFFRNIAVLFHFQWFLEMSSSLDHNLTPPPSIRFQVDMVDMVDMVDSYGQNKYNCITDTTHTQFLRIK